MIEHIPTPWRYQEKSDAYTHIVRSGDRFIFQLSQGTSGEAEATARFIVKAANSHDALKASLAEMVGIYWGEGDGHEPPPECIQRAMAALASIKETV